MTGSGTAAPAPPGPVPDDAPIGAAEFAALMLPLGPWPSPEAGATSRIVAVAVSGGADSTCLAVLAAGWAASHGLEVLALLVDHRLRPDSDREALAAARRLDGLGIRARVLTLHGLPVGPGLAERARTARYAALLRCCRDAGVLDLLLGHHAGDQAETVLMRERAGSGDDGLAGMAALRALEGVRLVRPLLSQPPDRLRATLRGRGIGWIEDPSNADRRWQRVRLRAELAAVATLRAELLARCALAANRRKAAEAGKAAVLAAGVALHPEGYALLPPGLLPPAPLSALIRTVAGRAHRPPGRAVQALSGAPRPATLGGVRLLPAGRLGPGWLMVREAAAMQGAVPAGDGAWWDGRFRLGASGALPEELTVSALGADAGGLRRSSPLPAAVLRTLPALRGADGALLAVPSLDWRAPGGPEGVRVRFRPAVAATDPALFTVR